MNPYYIPQTAPETPPPDFTLAKIIGSTDLAGSYARGLAGAMQANAERNRTELGMREMALNQQKQEQSFEMAKTAQAQSQQDRARDYELAKSAQTQKREYDQQLLPIKLAAENARGAYWQEKMGRMGQEEISNTSALHEYESKNDAMRMEAHSAAQKMGLLDAERWTKDPTGSVQNYQLLEQGYGTAPAATGVPALLSGLKEKVDALPKIKLRSSTTVVDEDGKEHPALGKELKEYSMYEAMRGLKSNNPTESKTWETALIDRGYIKPGTPDSVKTITTGTGVFGRPLWNKQSKEEIIPGKPDWREDWLKNGGAVDFTRFMPNRVPMDFPRRRPGKNERLPQQATSPDGEDAGIEPALPEPEVTQLDQKKMATDKLYDQARRAMGMPNANVNGIRDWMMKNNLDPGNIN